MFLEYKHVGMQQNNNMPDAFRPFLANQNFPIIIEIGTRFGAFTRFIKDTSPQSNVISYDIEEQKPSAVNTEGINFIIKNIFSPDFSEVIDAEALDILNSTTKKLILCDGGNKIKEFNCLSKYLHVGDFIMAHDYAKSHEYFDSDIRGRVWDWCEITESDIKDASDQYGLVNYDPETFQKAVWVCKIKVK